MIEFKEISAVEDLPDPRQHFFILIGNVDTIKDTLKLTLSEEETVKALAFKNNIDSKNYQYRHHLLNSIISYFLKSSPEEIKFLNNQWKKPFLDSNPFYFNISHSQNMFIIACGPHEIGVDVECIRNAKSFDLVREQHYHQNEKMDTQGVNKDVSFFKSWTRKEAYLKIIGTGLVNNLAVIDTSTDIVNEVKIDTLMRDNCIISIACQVKNISSIGYYHYLMT